MTNDSFDDLIRQNLDHIQETLTTVQSDVSELKQEFLIFQGQMSSEKLRNERIAGPLMDWSLDDSLALKSLIKKEKDHAILDQSEKERISISDKKIGRLQQRLWIISSTLGFIALTGWRPIPDLIHLLSRIHFS